MQETDIKQELLTRFDAFAEQLGVASEHVWETLILQSQMSGIIGLSLLLVSALLSTIGVVYFLRMFTSSEDTDREFAGGLGSIVTVVFLFAITIAFLTNGPDMIMQIANPEYYAFQEVAEILK